jgi:endogenous inhibitor of DNA gyrase (YacG/DUF329 family)
LAISMRYWVKIQCDTCGKTVEFESLQLGGDRIPIDWVQAAPSGEQMQREFCSAECVVKYISPPKPWEEVG